ncbi:MAG: inositol monophosphatase family protein [Promethearchaeota archaeon]|jgi:3'(2'), 5'-bisphosphate nucleotidase
MTHYKIELNLAVELVKTATDITEWFRVKGFKSFQKDDESPVTLADYASQLFIVKKLKEKFPNDQIIAEESYNSHIDNNVQKIIKRCYRSLELELVEDIERLLNYRGSYSPRQWTIDPIDGTKGFQKNLSYAVGIGFMINSELIAAVIGVPNYNEKGRAIFIAGKNQGTRVSYGEEDFIPISVTNKNNIKKAKMCHSLHYNEPWVMEFAQIAEISDNIQMDSMAKFCMVADGTADLYIKPMDENRSFSWDFLPGVLIVNEAGGIVSDLKGNNIKFNNEKCIISAPGLVASNGVLHEEILKYLKGIDF